MSYRNGLKLEQYLSVSLVNNFANKIILIKKKIKIFTSRFHLWYIKSLKKPQIFSHLLINDYKETLLY